MGPNSQSVRKSFLSDTPLAMLTELRFLDNVKTVEKWKLMHRPELETWVSKQSNFVFLGDACHPMVSHHATSQVASQFANVLQLPYLAQGANSSLEDGAVLGNLLSIVKSKDQLPEALKLYESLRKKRGEAIVRETFAQASRRSSVQKTWSEARR